MPHLGIVAITFNEGAEVVSKYPYFTNFSQTVTAMLGAELAEAIDNILTSWSSYVTDLEA